MDEKLDEQKDPGLDRRRFIMDAATAGSGPSPQRRLSNIPLANPYGSACWAPGDLLTQNLHGQASSAGLPDIGVPDASGGVMILINTTK
jgi:hypothetical protein